MREDNPNWYIRWNEELPSPEELIPISQSLITPHLARVFQIGISNHLGSNKNTEIFHQKLQSATPITLNSDFGADSTDLGSGSVGAGDEPARTLKRPRLVWTPQLHKRFVDAVGHLGIKNAVPKTIMQMMSVDGLTRENVASHLQKYRLYLRRMQGISNGNGNEISRSSGQIVVVSDTATDRLFASSPVPAHFLSSEYFMPPLMPMKYQQDHRQDQKYAHSQQRQFEFESGNGNGGGRKILTLFPTGNG